MKKCDVSTKKRALAVVLCMAAIVVGAALLADRYWGPRRGPTLDPFVQLVKEAGGHVGADSAGEPVEVTVIRGKVDDVLMREIGAIETIRSITIFESDLQSDDLRHVRDLPHLHYLSIRGPAIGDEAAQHLAEMDMVVLLDISDTTVSDDSIELIASMKSLRSVLLERTLITRSGVEHLKTMRPDVRILWRAHSDEDHEPTSPS